MKTQTNITDSPIAQGVKRIVRKFDPEAEVILYGSRARGDAQLDSDWDFLVLTSHSLPFQTEEALHAQLYGVQLEHEEVFNIFVEPLSWWESPLNVASPFYENVEHEGLKV